MPATKIHRSKITCLPIIGVIGKKKHQENFPEDVDYSNCGEWVADPKCGSELFEAHPQHIIGYLAAYIGNHKQQADNTIDLSWESIFYYLDNDLVLDYILKNSDAQSVSEVVDYFLKQLFLLIKNEPTRLTRHFYNLLLFAPILNSTGRSIRIDNEYLQRLADISEEHLGPSSFYIRNQISHYLITCALNDVGLAMFLLKRPTLISANEEEQKSSLITLLKAHHENLSFLCHAENCELLKDAKEVLESEKGLKNNEGLKKNSDNQSTGNIENEILTIDAILKSWTSLRENKFEKFLPTAQTTLPPFRNKRREKIATTNTKFILANIKPLGARLKPEHIPLLFKNIIDSNDNDDDKNKKIIKLTKELVQYNKENLKTAVAASVAAGNYHYASLKRVFLQTGQHEELAELVTQHTKTFEPYFERANLSTLKLLTANDSLKSRIEKISEKFENEKQNPSLWQRFWRWLWSGKNKSAAATQQPVPGIAFTLVAPSTETDSGGSLAGSRRASSDSFVTVDWDYQSPFAFQPNRGGVSTPPYSNCSSPLTTPRSQPDARLLAPKQVLSASTERVSQVESDAHDFPQIVSADSSPIPSPQSRPAQAVEPEEALSASAERRDLGTRSSPASPQKLRHLQVPQHTRRRSVSLGSKDD